MNRPKTKGQIASVRMLKPERVTGKINKVYMFAFGTYHVLIPVAFFTDYFSWTGLILAIVLGNLVGCLGINLCYHRCLSHRGMVMPKWLEYSLAVIGIFNLQDHPIRWVTTHRMHHAHSDRQDDPHSPRVSIWWSHVGWLLVKTGIDPACFRKYANDLMQDRFYVWLSRDIPWIILYLVHVFVIFIAGFAYGSWKTGTFEGSIHFSLEWLLWGLAMRTVYAWHVTWSVNSLTHVFGYRTHETGEDSRNNFLVGYLANGEGWHNNHHADPASARHGVRWWEFDLTWQFVKLFRLSGLATEVRIPKKLT